jgi:hypothetical protein
MADVLEGAEKAAASIPQLFYDLIARVVPGTAFLLALTWDRPETAGAFQRYGEAAKVLFLLGVGYAAGLTLTGLSNFLDMAWWWYAKWLMPRYKGNWEVLCDLKEHARAPAEVMQIASKVGRVDRAAADSLSKQFAEVTLCENLLVGLILLFVAKATSVTGTILDVLYPGWALGILVLLVIALYFRIVSTSGAAADCEKLYASSLDKQAPRTTTPAPSEVLKPEGDS